MVCRLSVSLRTAATADTRVPGSRADRGGDAVHDWTALLGRSPPRQIDAHRSVGGSHPRCGPQGGTVAVSGHLLERVRSRRLCVPIEIHRAYVHGRIRQSDRQARGKRHDRAGTTPEVRRRTDRLRNHAAQHREAGEQRQKSRCNVKAHRHRRRDWTGPRRTRPQKETAPCTSSPVPVDRRENTGRSACGSAGGVCRTSRSGSPQPVIRSRTAAIFSVIGRERSQPSPNTQIAIRVRWPRTMYRVLPSETQDTASIQPSITCRASEKTTSARSSDAGLSYVTRHRSMMSRPNNEGMVMSSSAGLQMRSSIAYPYSAASPTKAKYAGSMKFSETPPIPNDVSSFSMRIPVEIDHPFHSIPITDSIPNRSPVPEPTDH